MSYSVSSKIWLDVWPVEIDNLSSLQERNKWRSDVRYLKLQAIIDLCRNTAHQRKNREFYAERIPCNMVMMNENGVGDMIKRRCVFNSIDRLSTTGESPASSSLAPTPQVLISEQLREILREKIKEKEAMRVSAS
ncbi:hypothetical protein MLD38_036465 [Melastoma candidum]|uniref:Uncharacterized protein n=1 Tax=Melastoma candidum TaxID=119954 RepID=A0ACB9LJZ9_9MYRT|nr:hypothetical protein MLD38_036465 [Melastoma candidum]